MTLFNGKDLSGWHGVETMDPRKFAAMSADEKAKALEKGAEDLKKHWRVEDGVIVNDGQGAYLTTDKDYGDVELKVDFKIGPKGDSGVYLRGNPQVQIWDFTEPSYARMGADKGSGGLWNNTPGTPGKDPLVLADKPIGEWNTFRIIQVGERTTVYLNDKLVVDHARWENYWDGSQGAPWSPAARSSSRPTTTRSTGGTSPSARSRPTRPTRSWPSTATKGFRPIFNGENLADWAGPIENYEVVDGVLRCKPHKGGVIYYNEELKDFAARVEFKLPPGGNNGLAIRYPGHGDTAYRRHDRAPDPRRRRQAV